MEIKKFNEFMGKLDLGHGHKEIGLLAIIESLLEQNAGTWKKKEEGFCIIPPWLYDVRDSFIVISISEEPVEINITNKDLLSEIRERKPYIKVNEELNDERGGFMINIPYQKRLSKGKR